MGISTSTQHHQTVDGSAILGRITRSAEVTRRLSIFPPCVETGHRQRGELRSDCYVTLLQPHPFRKSNKLGLNVFSLWVPGCCTFWGPILAPQSAHWGHECVTRVPNILSRVFCPEWPIWDIIMALPSVYLCFSFGVLVGTCLLFCFLSFFSFFMSVYDI